MRAPIEPGNPGWDPDGALDRAGKVGGALRAAGLFAIVIAFLIVSQQFVSDDDEAPTNPGPALVYVSPELEPIAVGLRTDAVIRGGDSAELRRKIEGGAAADVFVGFKDDAQALIDGGHCADAMPVAGNPTEFAGCLVDRSGARTAAGAAFLKLLTGLDGRDALLEEGFDVPPR